MIFFCNLVVGQHVVKCVIELIRNLLDLQLLPIDFIFNVINPVVELGNVHLSIFITSFSMLQPLQKLVNLVLQLLFTLSGLLSRDLKLLHVFTNSLQFLLNILKLALSQFSTLSCPLALIFLYSKLPGQFIKLLLIVAGHLGGLSQGLVKLLNLNFIPHCLAFKVFDLFQDAISFLGSQGKLGDSVSKSSVCLLGLFLHQHDTSRQGTDFLFSILESLQFFLWLPKRLSEL